jgi:2'-5' RNA ligase
MGSVPNGVARVPAEQRLNVYALVIYVPDPLGRFLDDLRRALVPACNPHAHVSVLPPRPLAGDWRIAGEQVGLTTATFEPFEISLTGIEIFPLTNVVYLELGRGAQQMYDLHTAMNSGVLQFDEPFEYHPHITLAQDIGVENVKEIREQARAIWAAFDGSRSFRAERAAFVQNTMANCWIDLAEYRLGPVQPETPAAETGIPPAPPL